MKYLWLLFVIIPAAAAVVFFLLSQKYKSVFVPPTPTPSITLATQYCTQKDLDTNLITEGAAGNIYGTITIRNTSTKDCKIDGNKYISTSFSAKNITVKNQGVVGPDTIILKRNQTVFSQIHFPNGPQCSGSTIQAPVNFSYEVSPNSQMTFAPSGHLPTLTVTTCTAPNEVTQIDVWGISLQPLH